jgi:MATE family, multidrug efflux pump
MAYALETRGCPIGTEEINGDNLSRIIWSVSIPVIFAQINETTIHVIDTLFLARVGTVEVGAVALADTIFEIWTVLPIGLVGALQILLARRVGQGRDRAVGEAFNEGLVLLGALSIGLTAALLAAAPLLTGWLVHSPEVGAAVEAFLAIIAFAIFFNSANFAYSALLVGLARTGVLTWATLVLAVTNIALDYVLIFGCFGLPALGIRGAALGSLGAEVVTFLFLTAYALRYLEVRRYRLFSVIGWNGRLTASLLRLSGPVALQGLLEGVRWFTFFLILEWIGERALAVSNIVYACYAILRIPTEGFADTACSMVSRLVGEGQAGRIGHLMRESISPAYIVTLPLMLLALFSPDFVLSLAAANPAMIEAGRTTLRVVALAMLVDIPGEMWFKAVTGTGDTGAALAIEGALTVAMLGSTYLAAIVMGLELNYIWMSLPIAWMTCLALSWAWVRAGYWKRLEI